MRRLGVRLCRHPDDPPFPLLGLWRVHFLRLRNVRREGDALGDSFQKAEHPGGDTDMVAVIAGILTEERRRRACGRDDWNIPMRHDHGQDILDHLGRRGQPGYPTIGRLKGPAPAWVQRPLT